MAIFTTAMKLFSFQRLLDKNDIKENNDSAFTGFTSLDYVTVPSPLDCPGSKWDAWAMEKPNEPMNSTICQMQQTYCSLHNDSCIELEEYPHNAYCVPNGPSLFLCPCSEGVYGYKCLRRGTFPTAIFAPTLTVATVILSVVLWFTQRRFVITKKTRVPNLD